MKNIALLLFLLCAFVANAQKIYLNYQKSTGPFEWSIESIEFKEKETLISMRVKNYAIDTRAISFVQGVSAYTSLFPRGVWATKNSHQFTKASNNNIYLSQNCEIPFTLTFPYALLGVGEEMSIKVGAHYMLKGIKIPEVTLKDINRGMETWGQYYAAHRLRFLTYESLGEVKEAIRKEVENWQKKGEFESTSAWQNRVNDKTRQKFISDLTKRLSEEHEQEMGLVKTEQIALAKDYEKYKEDLLNGYYGAKKALALRAFNRSDFELRPYDADNETFLIHSKSYGDILLPVPIEEAPSFKANWLAIKNYIRPEYVPNGEEVALNKLIFTNKDKIYTYDSHTVANYAITDVNYNFSPVEIAEIDFGTLDVDGITTASNPVSSSIVGVKGRESVLSQNTVTPSVKQVSASDRSDVDISIPRNAQIENSTTFAVIIANEKYNNVSSVPFAENDGNILSKYLVHTLGLPQENVKLYSNATVGNMAAALKHIENLSLAFGDKLNLILYYAGHGVPDEKTKRCMLLPVDGDAMIPETCYDVDKLYTTLGEMNANSIVVLMDACFSGSLRGEGMLYASRGVRIKSSKTEPKGNMVVLSASQGDETAFPLEKEQHGMFTYFLLKCLQEKKGDVTLGQLSDYLIDQVKRQSVVYNGKLQTPMIQYSTVVENDWRTWRLVQ